MNEFSIGDKVKLKGEESNPVMVIKAIIVKEGKAPSLKYVNKILTEKPSAGDLICQFFQEGKYKEEIFPPINVVKIE